MKAEFRLTPKQKEALKPLFDEADKRAKENQYRATEERGGALLGQAWSDNDGHQSAGSAVFHYLTPKQFAIVNRAIRRAMKTKKIASEG